MTFFDYLNSINDTKVDIMVDDVAEKAYNGFLTNRGLSYFVDTILLANEMNRYHQLDNRLQYNFLINSIRKKKRWSKWLKPTETEDILIVKAYYGYNDSKAKSALSLLTSEQIQELKQRMYHGGLSNNNRSH
jgi:hypothetical protein